MSVIKLPLKASYNPDEGQSVDALFLHNKHEIWLFALLDFQLGNQKDLRFYRTTLSGRQGYFVLGIRDTNKTSSFPVLASFTRTGRGFYHPVFSNLIPCLNPCQLEPLEDPTVFRVWDSADRLWISIDVSNYILVTDFLKKPESAGQTAIDGRLTQVGNFYPTDIVSLQGFESSDILEKLGLASDDVGSKTDQLKNVPLPKSKSPKLSNTKFLSSPLKFLTAFSLCHLTRFLPRGGFVESFVGRASRWASAQFASQSMVDQDQRNSEIEKLLNMFGTDPEEALKYAIPMNGENQWFPKQSERYSGNRLVKRALGWSSFGFSGTDPWTIRDDYERKLFQKYSQAAIAAIKQGRYQQAAYIYARLLGDYRLAASTLKQGGLFREAATLYKQRLNDKKSAYECLQEGGFYEEAANGFKELGNWKRVADCYSELEWPEKRVDALRIHYDGLIQNGQILEAADVLYDDLREIDEAKSLVHDCWPNHPQSEEAIEKLLRWNGQDGDHERSRRFIKENSAAFLKPKSCTKFLRLLVNQSEKYPDSATRELCVVSAQQTLSKGLEVCDLGEQRELIGTFRRLFPTDPIFQSDCYRAAKDRFEKPRRESSVSHSDKRTKEVAKILLPDQTVSWRYGTFTGNVIVFVGTKGSNLFTCQYSSGSSECFDFKKSPTTYPGELTGIPVLFASIPGNPFQIVCHSFGWKLASQKGQLAHGVFDGRRWEIDSPNYLSPDVLALSSSNNEAFVCTEEAGALVLRQYDSLRNLSDSTSVDISSIYSEFREYEPIPLVKRGKRVFVGNGCFLLQIENGEITARVKFSTPVRRIVASQAGSRFRVAVALNDSVEMFWDKLSESKRGVTIEADFDSEIHMTGSGYLCIGRKNGSVYYCGDHSLIKCGTFGADAEIVTMFSCRNPNQFATIDTEGFCTIYQTPDRPRA